MSQIPLDLGHSLDHLIRGLRGQIIPTPPAKSLVGSAVYYLPSIRNENNIGLVAYELISSSIVLPVNDLTLSAGLYLIDAFASAAQRKSKVSNSTIPLEDWIYQLLMLCANMPRKDSWRAIPILVGLLESKTMNLQHSKMADQLIVEIVNTHTHSMKPISYLMCVSVSRVVLQVPHPQKLIGDSFLDILGTLVYLGPLESPEKDIVFQNLSGLSHLIKLAIQMSSTAYNMDDLLNHMESYGEKLNAWCMNYKDRSELPWTKLKTILFGTCLQLEGIANIMLTNPRFNSSKSYFASKILRTFSSFFFIITSLGQGDFDSYQFVYNVCIDSLEDPSDTVTYLRGKCNLGAVDPIQVSRIIFLLDFFEAVLPLCTDTLVEKTIMPIVNNFLRPGADFPLNHQDGVTVRQQQVSVLESAHSVMLAYLSIKPRSNELVKDYFKVIMSLFPKVLVATQFNLAVATIIRATSQNPQILNEFMEEIYIRAKTTLPGIILDQKGNTSTATASGKPQSTTIRGVLVNCLLHTLPFLDVMEFKRWLPLVSSLFRDGPSYSDAVIAERQYLELQFWDVLSSELGQTLADIGIQWWYNPRI